MVKIVTDSASDLPARLAKDLDIQIVPARILFGRKAFKDGIDINQNQFYTMLEKSYYHPNTTQAAPYDFYKKFRQLERDGEDILCITLPESLSALIRSAREGAAEINKVRVEIFNSGGVSTQQGLIAVAAARMAQQGYELNQIIREINELKKKTRLYAVAATLDYLKRGGRISTASYRIGSLLGVRPIITVEDEKVESIDKQLFGNMEKAADKIINLLKEQYSSEEPLECFVMHAQNVAGAAMMADKLEKNFNLVNFNTTRIGATIGANVGPGALGVAISPVIQFY